MDEIVEHEIKGSILRSLCKDYEEGEKCNEYFFSLEKMRYRQKTISCLKRKDGSLITNQSEILEECRLFYLNLYKKDANVSTDNFSDFFRSNTIPRLSEQKKEICEQDLTENELLNTLKAFKKNKSPGLDGLTAELFIEL